MKNIGVKIAVVVVILIMLIPIFSDISKRSAYNQIEIKDFDSKVNSTATYGFALIYVGKDDEANKESIKKIVDKYVAPKKSVEVYFMDIDKLKSEDILKIGNNSNFSEAYVFASNGEIIKTYTGHLSETLLDAYVSEYSVAYDSNNDVVPINARLVHYKVSENAAAYKKLVTNKKLVTMAVFGRDNCYYCNQFKPVYNTVAEEYDLDIYYFNSLSYDKDEYEKIMDMGLVIPAQCNNNKQESLLADGFGTPLTLFTKNGKVIDCISGYVNKSSLITKLKTVGLIEE